MKSYMKFIVLLMMFSECKTQNKECFTLSSEDYEIIISTLKDSLECEDCTVQSCSYLDKPYIYSTNIFQRHYISMKLMANDILDSLKRWDKKRYFHLNSEHTGLRHFIPDIEKSINGDSIFFLYRITTQVETIWQDVNRYYDTLFPKEALIFFDDKYLELKRAKNKMEHEFNDSLMILPWSSFAQTYFGNKHYLVVLRTSCKKHSSTAFVYVPREDEDKNKKPTILKILSSGQN